MTLEELGSSWFRDHYHASREDKSVQHLTKHLEKKREEKKIKSGGGKASGGKCQTRTSAIAGPDPWPSLSPLSTRRTQAQNGSKSPTPNLD